MLEPQRAWLGECWRAAAAGDPGVAELGVALVDLTLGSSRSAA